MPSEIQQNNLAQFFSLLNAKEIQAISENSFEIQYKTGDILFKENTPITHVVYIKSGLVKLCKIRYHKTVILKLIVPYNYIGLLSVMGSNVYDFSAVAVSDLEVYAINVDQFKKIICKNNRYLMNVFSHVCCDGLSIIDNLISINHKQLPGRIADVLLYFMKIYNSQTFTFPLSRKELAQFAGTSKESFIRTLTEFKNDKIIDMEYRNIHINSLDILEKLSKFG